MGRRPGRRGRRRGVDLAGAAGLGRSGARTGEAHGGRDRRRVRRGCGRGTRGDGYRRGRAQAHAGPAAPRAAPHPPPRLLPVGRSRRGDRRRRVARRQHRAGRRVKWATRSGPHVDRTACAWLIARFVDSDAEFVFVADPDEVPDDATPFDMRGAELSHHGGECSFEAILRRYELDDPVLWSIARIVHVADLDDDRYDAPAAPGLDVLLRGLSMVRGDHEVLALSGPLYDGLYEYLQRANLLGREPA